MNSSNFCFMNSILQALLFIPPFAQLAVGATTEAASVYCPTLSTLGKWFLQYWKQGLTRLCVSPPRLPFAMAGGKASTTSCAAASRGVDGSVQEDAQEFLHRMLEVVHSELCQLEQAMEATAAATTTSPQESERSDGAAGGRRGGGNRRGGGTSPAPSNASSSSPAAHGGGDGASMRGWTIVKGNEKRSVREHVDSEGRSALLDSVFGGTMESHLKGKSKQRDHASVVLERYYTLPVDVGFAMECTIEEALERTFATERIFDDERGKDLKKTLLLHRLPQVLFLHLRRWAITAEGELVKLDNVVRYSRTLILPRSVCSDETLSNKARTYKLLSVVAHRGASTGQGHYVTYLVQGAANPMHVAPAGQPVAVSGGGKQKVGGSEKGQTGKGGNGDVPAAARHLPEAGNVVLCNDAKVSLAQATAMERETAYFLVYHKCK